MKDNTTRNARKLKYYDVTFGDSTTGRIVVDKLTDCYWLDGYIVNKPEDIKAIKEAIESKVCNK